MSAEKLKNYINGELSEPVSKQYLDNYEPATGEVYSLCPDSDERDVELAVSAAKVAFESWSKTGLEERMMALMKIADGIEKRLEELAKAESKDNGKPVKLARAVDIRVLFLISGFTLRLFSILRARVIRCRELELITPCASRLVWWLYFSVESSSLFVQLENCPCPCHRKCVVAKPSEITPYTAYLLSANLYRSRFAEGSLNIVYGLGNKAGQAIVEHRGIKAISFTGGTEPGSG